MDIFAPVFTLCIISVLFILYLNIFYDITCQRLFEKEDDNKKSETDEEDIDINFPSIK